MKQRRTSRPDTRRGPLATYHPTTDSTDRAGLESSHAYDTRGNVNCHRPARAVTLATLHHPLQPTSQLGELSTCVARTRSRRTSRVSSSCRSLKDLPAWYPMGQPVPLRMYSTQHAVLAQRLKGTSILFDKLRHLVLHTTHVTQHTHRWARVEEHGLLGDGKTLPLQRARVERACFISGTSLTPQSFP